MSILDVFIKKRKSSEKTQTLALKDESPFKETSSHLVGALLASRLSQQEELEIEHLLYRFAPTPETAGKDLKNLISITSEVKAINNQAIMLHGERIKRAQTLLKPYKDGAFTAWLINAYGNRQTPYNFLQYYEFYNQIPPSLHPKIESMPRQVIYTLASRNASLERKTQMLKQLQEGEKKDLIERIRQEFPLKENDKRKMNKETQFANTLFKLEEQVQDESLHFDKDKQEKILSALKVIQQQISSFEIGSEHPSM